MSHSPDFAEFRRLAQGARLVPVFRHLVSDTLTPVTAFRQLDSGPCSCLFESVIGGEKVGRYSFLATAPFLEFESRGERVTVRTPEGDEEFTSADPLAELRHRLGAWTCASVPGLPPFCGGAIGYAGYDVVRYMERLPNPPPDDRQLPDLAFAFFDRIVVFDNVTKVMTVIALARVDADSADGSQDGGERAHRVAYEEACSRVDEAVERLSRPDWDLRPADIDVSGAQEIEYESNFTRSEFEQAVEKCLEYIRAGDIFQVVLSQRLKARVEASPFELYRTLRVVNPSPFMFYLRGRAAALVGSSPEIMVRVSRNAVTVRPLAGTRPRGASESEDVRLAEELLADPKERAEHVMLVDLGRNDVGRVARYGSIRLTDVMTIERYSHVMHITSNVTGELAPDRDAFDALRACLPAGTVSGAPKVRAMEIIDELEPTRRGPYAGAVGYVDFKGDMDTCIALRTIVVSDGWAYVQAGAGIVADSLPASEYEETLNKARGPLKAIWLTERRNCRRP